MPQVLAIWLDGFDIRLAEEWELPTLKRLACTSAHSRLNSGVSHLTGLTGEHLATGLDPAAAGRTGAVHFDPETYRCTQEGFAHPTAFGGVPTVVLDPCYFDLADAPSTVQGLVDWGAHDPGSPPVERPVGLHTEVRERFGEDPAREWMYATPWASPDECARMGADLVRAVETRTRVANWLLGVRLPEWQLAFVGVSEAHSASEGLCHGADSTHPLHSLPSGEAAATAIKNVYLAIDRLVADLIDAFPDAIHVVFTMHGMGINSSDVPSMVLLGELLRRWAGDPTPDVSWPTSPTGIPLLHARQSWGAAVRRQLEPQPTRATRIARSLPEPVRRLARRVRRHRTTERRGLQAADDGSLRWMPVMRHAPHWSTMRAFALPAFYDGRVRVNVRGRESCGTVSADEYTEVLDELETLLAACRDTITGEPVVADFIRPLGHPLDALSTDADLVVTWAGVPLGLSHPDLGTIGPFPPRRTGGHASPWGACFVHGPGIEAVDLGVRSSFDVLPTIFELADSPSPWPLSGEPIPIREPFSNG